MNSRRLHVSLISTGAVALMLTVAFLASAGDAGAAPNLVQNGTFDSGPGFVPWTAAAGTNLTQIPSEDADLNPSSGALTDVIASGGTGKASQCIDISSTGNGTYQIAASYKSVSGTSGTEAVQVNVTVFDDTACTTNAAAHPSGDLPGVPTSGWLTYTGNVIISGQPGTQQSMLIDLVINGNPQDGVYFDNVAISNGPLDTPTPTATNTATNTPTPTNTATPTNTPTDTPTATATNTPAPTNTPGGPTNTPTATNTAAPTNTPMATNTPAATNTPNPTNTATEVPTDTSTAVPTATNTVQPTATEAAALAPPEAPIDESPSDESGTFDESGSGISEGGEGTLGEAAAGGEQPEDATDVGALGYGPQHKDNGGSAAADIVAALSFGAAIVMLATGFALQRGVREEDR